MVRHDRTDSSKWLPEDILEARKKNYYIKPQTKNIVNMDKTFDELDMLTNNVYDIKCLFQNNSQVFLNWRGQLWPCCFLSGKENANKNYRIEMDEKLYQKYGKNFNSLYHHTFDEILKNSWYNTDLTNSWEIPSKSTSGCISVCNEKCGIKGTQRDHKPISVNVYNDCDD